MKINTPVKRDPVFTHEGAKAKHINAEQQLRRLVMNCLLWESEFYSDGQTIASQIKEAIAKVSPEKVAAIAIEARERMKLRHVPLLIVREMARLEKHKGLVAETLERVIQRPDELTEFCAIWNKGSKKPLAKTLSAQAKKGLARAFQKFNEYSLAKWNKDGAIKLRDVLFLCHAKPKDSDQDILWKKLVDGKLATPDTWEVELSAGKGEDKKESWTRLLSENKLGALALLRNLRNFQQAGVDMALVKTALDSMKAERVLPFRFIAAARYAPQLEPALEAAMFRCLDGSPKIKGRTALLVDVSGSMDAAISAKSDLQRIDAACALAMLLREVCEDFYCVSFSSAAVEIPLRRGFAIRDAILISQPHSSTQLGGAVQAIINSPKEFDRLIVITDEQAADHVPDPGGLAYMINVASAKNGVGYGPWTHIDGFSEAVVSYIMALETVTAD